MVVVEIPSELKPSMGKSIRKFAAVTRVGIDLAKGVFQVHTIDARGEIVAPRKLARGAIEKDATGQWRVAGDGARLRPVFRARPSMDPARSQFANRDRASP